MDILLKLLKDDLSLVHNLMDEYLTARLEDSMQTLVNYGISLDLETSQDRFLIVDYTAWQYRKRANDTELVMPRNLIFRINSRKIQSEIKELG